VSTPSSFAIDVPERLLRDAQRGDERALEQLYRWFERPVYSLALRMLANPDDAQDVLQDAFIKLFDKLAGFRGDSPFWGWLRQIAVNECLMRLRKRGRDGGDGEEAFEPDLLEHEGLLPPQAADAQRLGEALQALSPTTRSVLWLYHAEGYTHEEIAAAMGKSLSFSKSQLARGTRRVRERLAIAELHHA
jgi:RNA polymerase sigma-70 factor (ECF subfamily)